MFSVFNFGKTKIKTLKKRSSKNNSLDRPKYDILEFNYEKGEIIDFMYHQTSLGNIEIENGNGLRFVVKSIRGNGNKRETKKGVRINDIMVSINDKPILTNSDIAVLTSGEAFKIKVVRLFYTSTDESVALFDKKKTHHTIKKHKSIDSEKLDMDSYLKKNINQDGMYDHFFHGLSEKEQNILSNYQQDVGDFTNNSSQSRILESIFRKAPKLPSTIYVYRCFISNVSIESLDNQHRFDRFLSTSLSHNIAFRWCKNENTQCYRNPDKKENLEICIILPKGSRVLPLLYAFYDAFNEYEILLPLHGTIVSTGECHPKHGLPIFIFFEDIHRADEYKKSMRQTSFQRTPPHPETPGQQPSSRKPSRSRTSRSRSATDWKSWLEKMLKKPEKEPEGFEYSDAVVDAFG